MRVPSGNAAEVMNEAGVREVEARSGWVFDHHMEEHEFASELLGRVSGPLAALSGSHSKAPGFAA